MRQAVSKPSDRKKLTINRGYGALVQIDLLVSAGDYANRSDFNRTAIRNQAERHADLTRQSMARKSVELGLRHYRRSVLERLLAAGETLDIRVLGLAVIEADVPADLARATIGSIEVLGSLQASPAVREALADRLR